MAVSKYDYSISDFMAMLGQAVNNFKDDPTEANAQEFKKVRQDFVNFLDQTSEDLEGTIAHEAFLPLAGPARGDILRLEKKFEAIRASCQVSASAAFATA